MEAREVLRPKPVEVAVHMLSAALFIGLIRAVFGSKLASAGIDPLLLYAISFGTYALLGLFLYKTWTGKNWARLTYAAIFVLGLFKTIPVLLSALSASPVASSLSLALVVVQVVAIALLFLPQSNSWFKQPGL